MFSLNRVSGYYSTRSVESHRSLGWGSEECFKEESVEGELRRVTEICAGCRRCEDLCNTFPALFEVIDNEGSGSVSGMGSKSFAPVVDSCIQCEQCFAPQCPYVPPHEFAVDFPSLMLRAKAASNSAPVLGALEDLPEMGLEGELWKEADLKVEAGVDRGLAKLPQSRLDRLLADRDGVGSRVSGIARLANATIGWKPSRIVLERLLGVHRDAPLLPFAPSHEQFVNITEYLEEKAPVGPGVGLAAVLFPSCIGNWHDPGIPRAAWDVLAWNGVAMSYSYPGCCGAPLWDQGKVAELAKVAKESAAILVEALDEAGPNAKIVSVTSACGMMLQNRWQRLLPNDPNVARVAESTVDVSDYVVDELASRGNLRVMGELAGNVSLHRSCLSRAQNSKVLQMLELMPGVEVLPTEGCSGGGCSSGVKVERFDDALRQGKHVARAWDRQSLSGPERRGAVGENGKSFLFVASECPAAGAALHQGMRYIDSASETADYTVASRHPVELMAAAYDLPSGIPVSHPWYDLVRAANRADSLEELIARDTKREREMIKKKFERVGQIGSTTGVGGSGTANDGK